MSKQLRATLGCAKCGATVLRVEGTRWGDLWHGHLYTEGDLDVWPVTVNMRNGTRKILRHGYPDHLNPHLFVGLRQVWSSGYMPA